MEGPRGGGAGGARVVWAVLVLCGCYQSSDTTGATASFADSYLVFSLYRRYFVPEEKKQATMTGSEHRRALPFLPFAVVGVAGSDGDGVDHSTLTLAICELVHVTNELFSARCTGGGITLAEAEVLTTKAHKWVVDHYQPVLGPSHTTKLHRMAAHLLDEFRLRGNLYDGNTAYNETLHKAVKKAYNLTNHRRDQFIEQLILVEQVSRILLDDGADEPPSATSSEVSSDPEYDSQSSDARQRRRRRRRRRGARRRRYTKQYTIAHLAHIHGLPGLGTALGVSDSTTLGCAKSLYYGDPARPRRGRMSHTVRAAQSFHGAPWFDWVRYRGPGGELRVGQAALVTQARSSAWARLVVRRAESAPTTEGCVLTKYGCERLQWSAPADADAARLDAVEAKDIVRWLSVEHDWEDLCERHGATVMPDKVPKTTAELRAARFFVNAFVSERARDEGDWEEGECESE